MTWRTSATTPEMAAAATMAGMVGEGDGVDRPGLDAEALQAEHRGRVADMAPRHPGLDGEHIHARQTLSRGGADWQSLRFRI